MVEIRRFKDCPISLAMYAASLQTGAPASIAAFVTQQRQQLQRLAFALSGSNFTVGVSPFREGLPQGKAEVGKEGRQGKERVGKDPAGGTRAPPKSATLEQAGFFREECCKPGD